MREQGALSVIAIAQMRNSELLSAFCGVGKYACSNERCGNLVDVDKSWRCGKRGCRARCALNIVGVRIPFLEQIVLVREFAMLTSTGKAALNTGLHHSTVGAAYKELRRKLAERRLEDQEKIAYPSGSTCEVDEVGLDRHALPGNKYGCRVVAGFVQRGATFKSLYLRDWGVSVTNTCQRFPRQKASLWQDMWTNDITQNDGASP